MSDQPQQELGIQPESELSAGEQSGGAESADHEKRKAPSMQTSGSVESAVVAEITLDPTKEKALLRRLDMVFIPVITLTYISCFLDRSNIGGLGHVLCDAVHMLILNSRIQEMSRSRA